MVWVAPVVMAVVTAMVVPAVPVVTVRRGLSVRPGVPRARRATRAGLVARVVLQQHPQQLGSLLHIQAVRVGP